MSHSQVSPVWALDVPSYMEDKSTEYFEYREIREARSDLTNVTRLTLETQDRDSYQYLPAAYIKVDLQCTASDGTTALTADQKLALVNNGVQKLFKRAELLFDNNQVQNLNDPAFAHMVKTLVESSAEHIESVGQNQFWHLDSLEDPLQTHLENSAVHVSVLAADGTVANTYAPTGQYNEIQLLKAGGAVASPPTAVSDIRKNSIFNKGFKIRVDRCKGAISAQIPLGNFFDVAREFQRCIKGPIIKVNLDLEDHPQEYMFGDNTGTVNPKVVVSKIALWIPALKPNPSLLAQVESKLASGKKLSMKYGETLLFSQYNIASNTSPQNFRVPQNLRKPLRCYVCFQNIARRTSYQHNSMVLDHINITEAEVRLNGVQYPAEKYVLTGTDYSRAVSEIQRLGCKMHDGKSLVNMENWRSTYPILVFDFEAVPDTAMERVKAVDLELRWRSGTTAPGFVYNTHMVITEERLLEYDLVSSVVKFSHVS